MHFHINRFRNKTIMLFPWFFPFLSISLLTLFTIIAITSTLVVYAIEENNMLEDKKLAEISNNIENHKNKLNEVIKKD
jgi:uncharacterized protein YpmS